MDKTKNVPVLRFPEFSGEWEVKELGNISSYTKGFAFKSIDYQTEGIRIVRVSDLTESSIKRNNEIIFVDVEKASDFIPYKLIKNDIIITTVGSKPELSSSAVGRGILITRNNEGLLNQNMLKLNISNKINNVFLFGQINTNFYISHIKSIQRGNANQSNVTVKDLLRFEVGIPEFQEQQKIANFLSLVDRKIEQLTQKKQLIERYKKAMMQTLFSQQLRFKDHQGNDYPDWEVKKLGDILKIGSGKDYKHLPLGDIPVYGTGGYMTSVNEYLYDGESIGIGRKGTIDKPLFLTGKFWTIDTLFYTHSFNGATPMFIFLLFQTINWKKYNEASGVPSLSKRTLEVIEINIPPIQEQTKIANYLTHIDQKIQLVDTQLKQAQQFKQGLLQKMFV